MPAPSGAGFLVLLMKKRLTATCEAKRVKGDALVELCKNISPKSWQNKTPHSKCGAKRVKGDALVELCKNISPKSWQNKTPHSKCGA